MTIAKADKMSAKYRSREQISKEILETALESATKTKIQWKAMLEYHQCQKKIDELMQAGLLSVDAYGRIYTTTEKGREWLKTYGRLNELSVPMVC